MSDLLHLPQTKYRYRYLLVITDLWSNNFDIEPIRTKTPDEVLKAMKKIMNREYIPEIKASIRTDAGKEFGGIYHKWLYDNDIFHRIAEPNRHQQNANAENLNKMLGRLLNGFMNSKELETGKVFKQWDQAVPIIREDLNEIRHREDGDPQKDIMTPPTDAKPKFKINDVVFFKSEKPRNALGQVQPTNTFRMGDYRFDITNPKKIKQIVYYPKNVRYILDGKNNVSKSAPELKLKR
jgi:transposase InsO family protein